MAQVIGYLLTKCEAMSSNPKYGQKKESKRIGCVAQGAEFIKHQAPGLIPSTTKRKKFYSLQDSNSVVLQIFKLYANGTILYLFFCNLLSLFNILVLRFIYIDTHSSSLTIVAAVQHSKCNQYLNKHIWEAILKQLYFCFSKNSLKIHSRVSVSCVPE